MLDDDRALIKDWRGLARTAEWPSDDPTHGPASPYSRAISHGHVAAQSQTLGCLTCRVKYSPLFI